MIIYIFGYMILLGMLLVSVDRRCPVYLSRLMFSFMCVTLLVFCALRGDIDPDHHSYLNIYGYITQGQTYLIEPAFYFFTWLSYYLINSPALIFIGFAFISLTVKHELLRKYSLYPLLSLLIYYCNYYILHDMTQIRIGVAIGIAFAAIVCWFSNRRYTYYLLIFISFLFHYSALMFLIVPFLPKGRVKNKELLIYIFVLVFAYVLYAMKFGLASVFSYIPIGFVQEKFLAYSEETRSGALQPVNVFSMMQMLKLAVIALIFLFANRRYSHSPFHNTMFRFYIFSSLFWVMFFDIPAFSIRISELFGFSEVFLLPCLMSVSARKSVGLGIIISITLFMFYLNIYHNKILLPWSAFWE